MLEKKPLAHPDEVRRFAHGSLEVVTLAAGSIGKGTFEPGWQWSTHIGPATGTRSCPVPHLGYVVSGRMMVVMPDGEQLTLEPGDVFSIPPGHDAWTLGAEACVLIDFAGAATYAKA